LNLTMRSSEKSTVITGWGRESVLDWSLNVGYLYAITTPRFHERIHGNRPFISTTGVLSDFLAKQKPKAKK
jgi:hypothetical protein